MKIKEVIVVEGKHDREHLNKFLDCDTIITNGSEISEETIELIKVAQSTRGVIVFTDPDFNGEKVRKIINDKVPGVKNAFVNKKDAQGKRNLGIEFASKEVIINSLNNLYQTIKDKQTITWEQYIDTKIFNNKQLRIRVGELLNIGTPNNKTFFKRLNMFNITKEELEVAIKTVENR